MSEPGTLIEMPSRNYTEPMDEKTYRSLSDRQRIVADCWYSRNHDGYVRHRHLQQLVAVEEHFVIPYVLAALGDYVIEIVHELETASSRWADAGSWQHHHYRQFASYKQRFHGAHAPASHQLPLLLLHALLPRDRCGRGSARTSLVPGVRRSQSARRGPRLPATSVPIAACVIEAGLQNASTPGR